MNSFSLRQSTASPPSFAMCAVESERDPVPRGAIRPTKRGGVTSFVQNHHRLLRFFPPNRTVRDSLSVGRREGNRTWTAFDRTPTALILADIVGEWVDFSFRRHGWAGSREHFCRRDLAFGRRYAALIAPFGVFDSLSELSCRMLPVVCRAPRRSRYSPTDGDLRSTVVGIRLSVGGRRFRHSGGVCSPVEVSRRAGPQVCHRPQACAE